MYILQEDEDGCTVAVQSFAAVWNIVETELVFMHIMSVRIMIIFCFPRLI